MMLFVSRPSFLAVTFPCYFASAPASGAPHPSSLFRLTSSPKPPLAPYPLQPLPWRPPSAPLGSVLGRRSQPPPPLLYYPLPPVCAGVTGLFLRDGHPDPAREGCRWKGQSQDARGVQEYVRASAVQRPGPAVRVLPRAEMMSWRKQPLSTLNGRVGLLQALDYLCDCLAVLNSARRGASNSHQGKVPVPDASSGKLQTVGLCAIEEKERERERDVLSSKESTCFGACIIAARLTRGMSQVYCQKVLSSNHSSHLTFLYRGKRLKPEQVTANENTPRSPS